MTGASLKDWHVGPVFEGSPGYHHYLIEFLRAPEDLGAFRRTFDELLVRKNDHYAWFRAEGGGMPSPAISVVRAGGFDAWMKSRGKLGGQHKVPRIDSSGRLLGELLEFLQGCDQLEESLKASPIPVS